MEKYEPLYGSPCPCCKGPRQLVRSRPGGFVTQNCLNFDHCETCRRGGYPSLGDLPELYCDRCNAPLVRYQPDKPPRNYRYRCDKCKETDFQLALILPHWSDVFPYCGVGVDSDNIDNTMGSEVPLSPTVKIEFLPNPFDTKK